MQSGFLYFICSLILFLFVLVIGRKITVGVWSIKVFRSDKIISDRPDDKQLEQVSLTASDVTDVPAEFVADPFIIVHQSTLYIFFEVLDKSTGKGVIGLASSKDGGATWEYEKTVLKEDFHLSYPYVFKHKDKFYMIPESSEARKVLLYKAKNFPYEWEVALELVQGTYVDSSIFHYNAKWWMLAGRSGKMHLFFSESPEGTWREHPKSPLISNNYSITRPGGRVIVDGEGIYRYTQDGRPHYGSAIRAFQITKLTELEYEEREIGLVLSGSNKGNDWKKDGMHSIDQLKLEENNWIVAVDGHKLVKKRYLIWKLDRLKAKVL